MDEDVAAIGKRAWRMLVSEAFPSSGRAYKDSDRIQALSAIAQTWAMVEALDSRRVETALERHRSLMREGGLAVEEDRDG
jgi:hypothetical protein